MRPLDGDDMEDGIALLRRKRGPEWVCFGNIADHMQDYMGRHPGDRAVIDRFARFLAAVENVRHDHDLSPDRGLAGVPEQELPAQRKSEVRRMPGLGT
jgi:hypothetical protein